MTQACEWCGHVGPTMGESRASTDMVVVLTSAGWLCSRFRDGSRRVVLEGCVAAWRVERDLADPSNGGRWPVFEGPGG